MHPHKMVACIPGEVIYTPWAKQITKQIGIYIILQYILYIYEVCIHNTKGITKTLIGQSPG